VTHANLLAVEVAVPLSLIDSIWDSNSKTAMKRLANRHKPFKRILNHTSLLYPYMAAELVPFRATLGRLRFNNQQQDAIIAEGLRIMQSLLFYQKEQN
jgi:hypothetical protein